MNDDSPPIGHDIADSSPHSTADGAGIDVSWAATDVAEVIDAATTAPATTAPATTAPATTAR